MRPTAVTITSGLPPGWSEKAPLFLSKQLSTNRQHASLSRGAPPKYFNARGAAPVARRLGLPGVLAFLGKNPPSGVCNARTQATVACFALASGAWARTGD